MLNLKSVIGASLFAVSAMAASSAFAYAPLNSTSTTAFGPTTLSYIGQNVPCHSAFTIHVDAAGAATITAASFTQGTGDSSFCPSITANSLPWTIGTASYVAGSGTPGSYTAPVSGVSVTVPGLHVTCTGSVTITLNDTLGVASFSGTLHNGAIACGVSGTGLNTSVTAP